MDSGGPNLPGDIDLWRAISVTATDDLLLTGEYDSQLFASKKIAGSSGGTLWRHELGPVGGTLGGGCCVGTAVSSGDQGDAYVAGWTWVGAARALVAKLDGSTGSPSWQRLLDVPFCGDSPFVLDLGQPEAVVIAGSSWERIDEGCQLGRYLVVKLDSATGEDWVGPLPDVDADGIPDATDNCLATANADQADADADGLGDACDPFPNAADHEQAQCDLDLGTCVVSLFESSASLAACNADLATCGAELTTCRATPNPDMNGDGVVNVLDLVLLARQLAGLPSH